MWLARYHICSNFPYWTIKVNQCCLWLEFIKNIAIKKRALDGNLERILEKVIRVKLSLDQNLLDMLKVTTQFKQYFFYKDGSNLPKRTIWVKPYCPVIKIYKKRFKEKEKSNSKDFIGNPWEHKMAQMVLYLEMSLLNILPNTIHIEPKTDKIFLNE